MRLNKHPNKLVELIPGYLNGTIDLSDRHSLEQLMEKDPRIMAELAAWKAIQAGVKSQPTLTPSGEVLSGLLGSIHSGETLRSKDQSKWFARSIALSLALLVFLGLWWLVRPGVVLGWKVSGELPTEFILYRAHLGSENFKLIHKVAAQQDVNYYEYTDLVILPGQAYQYKVEGIGSFGGVILSRSVTINPLSNIPGVISILIISSIIGLASIYLLKGVQLRQLTLHRSITF